MPFYIAENVHEYLIRTKNKQQCSIESTISRVVYKNSARHSPSLKLIVRILYHLSLLLLNTCVKFKFVDSSGVSLFFEWGKIEVLRFRLCIIFCRCVSCDGFLLAGV